MKPQITYNIRPGASSSRLIHIELTIENNQSKVLEVCLPKWRPGRYELGNFARNIYQFSTRDALTGKELSCQKQSSHQWFIQTEGASTIRIIYSYYAAELNAGSTFLDNSQLYINPVNCCLYLPGRTHEPCLLHLDIPAAWLVATALPPAGQAQTLLADSFDTLADSPLIASENLQYKQFELNSHTFFIWFCGDVNPNWEQLLVDFRKFCEVQLHMMGPLPLSTYHFLFQITPHPFYHGVEHLASTVCALGPGYKLFKPALYRELLGVSSHELFHAWNIKYIRPLEMYPYDYSKENYSRMGWVYEGITTYYGDQFLIRAGVFSETDFLDTLNDKLRKHFTSYGRFNQAVAEASFDTWLDGYVTGIPHRKTSIYTEGSLVAFIFDQMIREASNDLHSLDDFMRSLLLIAKQQKGYCRNDLIALLSDLCQTNMEAPYRKLVESASDLEPLLNKYGQRLGLQLAIEEPYSAVEHQFGFLLLEGSTDQVKMVAPDSPAEKAGLSAGDQIIAINGWRNRQQFSSFTNAPEKLQLQVFSGEALQTINLEAAQNRQRFFQSRKFHHSSKPENEQQLAWKSWTGTTYPKI